MTDDRRLLLATAALALGRAPTGVLSTEEKTYLAQFIGNNDWRQIADVLLPLIQAVAQAKT
jgi:hypothetical protein